jgi:hypothetical protein
MAVKGEDMGLWWCIRERVITPLWHGLHRLLLPELNFHEHELYVIGDLKRDLADIGFTDEEVSELVARLWEEHPSS